MTHHIKIKKIEPIYSGFNRINKYFFEFCGFDGETIFNSDKEIFERKDAVAVLLYDPTLNAVVIIEQFRPGCFVAENIAYPLEIPAGLIDEDDTDPAEVAKREAEEEANCTVTEIMKIGSYYPEISFSSRKIHLFCARVDASEISLNGGVKKDAEDTRITLVPLEELKTLMDDGKIINSHTLIAVQWFFLNLDKVRKAFL